MRPLEHERRRSVENTLRIATYLRVSTGRQAETDLSIPDQKRQIAAWADARGYTIVHETVEAGASATDDRRTGA
jgi:site-specific DNA recombinase